MKSILMTATAGVFAVTAMASDADATDYKRKPVHGTTNVHTDVDVDNQAHSRSIAKGGQGGHGGTGHGGDAEGGDASVGDISTTE